MLADLVQTFGVVLIVVAAAGYLLLVLRRSWRQGGGCGCCGTKTPPFSTDACGRESPGEPARTDRVPSKQIISVDRLADSARDCARESTQRPPDPPGQSS